MTSAGEFARDFLSRMMASSPEEKRRDTALHEATHAVIGHAVGAFIRKVSIDEGHAGVAWITLPGRRTPERLFARRQSVALLAGHITDLIVALSRIGEAAPVGDLITATTCRYLRGEIDGNPAEDMPRAAAIAKAISPNQDVAAEFIRASAMESESMIRELWPAIEAVAESVLISDPLDGDQFRAVIRPWAEDGNLGEWPYPFTDASLAALARSLGVDPP